MREKIASGKELKTHVWVNFDLTIVAFKILKNQVVSHYVKIIAFFILLPE